MEKHKAVILAGGLGTRLYPVTYEIPKALLPIKKKPIINYLVDLFLVQGVKDIAVLVNSSFYDEFLWWKKRHYSKSNIYIIKEEEPLGTFGGLCLLKNWLKNSPFFLSNGDELKKIDLNQMADFHKKMDVLETIALVKVPDPKSYGVAVCRNGMIREIVEKPENPVSNYISAGLYLFSPEIFNYHPGKKFSMIEKDVSPILASEGKLGGFKFKGKWMDCGTFERYERAIKEWK